MPRIETYPLGMRSQVRLRTVTISFMRICPRCGFKDPAQIAAHMRYEKKRLARLKAERAEKRKGAK